jgi:hypothetical protein
MSEVPLKALRRTCKHGAGRSRSWARLSVHGYPTHRKPHPPLDPTVAICLGPCGSPLGASRFLMSKVPLYRCKREGRQRPRLAALPYFVRHPPCEDENERHEGLPQGALLSDGKGFQVSGSCLRPFAVHRLSGVAKNRPALGTVCASSLYTGAPRSVQGRHAHAKSPPKGPKGPPF